MTKGRPRQFETGAALDKAMLVFWRQGYRGTSLDDLTDAMEINRPSLYGAFGDKEKLFLSVIDHYRFKFLVPPARRLLECENLSDGLTQYMRAMGTVILNGETPPGCMIACLLSDECCDSEIIKAKLVESIQAADSTFERLFEQHITELKEGVNPSAAAGLLTAIMHGLSIRARAGASRNELLKIWKQFMNLLLI